VTWVWPRRIHCHLVHDSLENTSSISFTLTLLKQEGEFSVEFAGENCCACSQFHVSQWWEDDRWTCQSEVWLLSPPTWFVRPEFVRFLAIWNGEAENQGSNVLDEWRNDDRFSWGMGRADLGRHAIRFLQLDWKTWMSQ
jgi:hypothetical protein